MPCSFTQVVAGGNRGSDVLSNYRYAASKHGYNVRAFDDFFGHSLHVRKIAGGTRLAPPCRQETA
ncbi:hypothetical protein GCM10020258_07630 [Sphingomonas yabuuchiae]|uniref:Uncharacterized protein n=1 Tax=Sphingomonas yabuuchiae TaxID=172044 RepID=A0ABR6K8K0_9SPHN|nr:hypothetical protein [Sphingomonas yabuuchiae]